MMLFAHTGITLGLVWLPHRALQGLRPGGPRDEAASIQGGAGSPARGASCLSPDYRLVVVGSMLPDIIDKPLGTWLLRDTLSSGRIYAHTLLFSAAVLLIGLALYAMRRQAAGLWLGFGSIVHLCLDQMWREPGTLLWPLYGWGFPRVDTNGWVERVFANMFRDPAVYVPEIIGAAVLAAFLVHLVRRRGVLSFLVNGEAG